MRPKFEERKETMLAYVEHQGPYSEIPWRSYMERLYGWAKEQKVLPGMHAIGIYYDDPKAVPAERCRSDIAITFKGEASGTEEVKVRKLPATKVAALSFKAPGEGIIGAYNGLLAWIADMGYRATGPPMEIYSKKPEAVDGVILLYSKIVVPVEPD